MIEQPESSAKSVLEQPGGCALNVTEDSLGAVHRKIILILELTKPADTTDSVF